jgi:biopolymer transport protein ExbB
MRLIDVLTKEARAALIRFCVLLVVIGSPCCPVLAQQPAPGQSSPATGNPVSPAVPTPGTDTATTKQEYDATAGSISLLPKDLSPWGMFLSADIVVKAVIIGLAFASIVTWTVWLAKSIELFFAKRQARSALEMLGSAVTLSDVKVSSATDPAAQLRSAAFKELRLSADAAEKDGLKERIASRLERIETACSRRISHGTGVLATIGATAPFVGLFGTVWGIMNSFIGISKSHTTNLAIVAPGIAEALLATAFGLAAAIPAVVIYNVFARSIAGYRNLLGDTSAEVLRLISRDLDRSSVARKSTPTAAE